MLKKDASYSSGDFAAVSNLSLLGNSNTAACFLTGTLILPANCRVHNPNRPSFSPGPKTSHSLSCPTYKPAGFQNGDHSVFGQSNVDE